MKITIKTKDFLSFLKLFHPADKIEEIQLGDTLYKKEGWIDKSILNGNHTITGIINLNYKFKGLQCFVGKIDNYQVILQSRKDENLEFEIESNPLHLKKLEYKVIELNAYHPNTFNLEQMKEYK